VKIKIRARGAPAFGGKIKEFLYNVEIFSGKNFNSKIFHFDF